jgi:hypothetical protein
MASIGIPFLPQAQITEQILQGIHQANVEHQTQLENAARQRQLDIAQQEAAVAADRLATEKPLIQANVTREQLAARAESLRLANEQNAQAYIFRDAAGTEPHPSISSTLGNSNLIHPDVASVAPPAQTVSTPLVTPDQLNVQSPVGQTLSKPAPPQQGSEASVPGSTPKLSPLDRDVQESIRLAGGGQP